jgi:hypothetical protein
MRALVVILLLGLPAWAKPPFPDEFEAKPARVIREEAPAGVAFAWRTEHYLFHSDAAIAPEAMKRFATTMEAVPQLLESLPLPLMSQGREDPLVIQLCRDAERFESLGGPVGAAGYYDGRRGQVLLRADYFLTPPPMQPTRLQPRPNESLLVHELCHAHMDRIVAVGRPWIYEGLAEYFAAAHVGGGRFRFHDSVSRIRNRVDHRLPPSAAGTTVLPRLAGLTGLSGKQWIEVNQLADPRDTQRPYVGSLLLVHYYLEGGAERRKAFTDHLTALQEFRDWRRPRPEMALNDAPQVEERLQRFWSSRGLQLRFPE